MLALSLLWPEASTAGEVLERIRNESSNDSEKGRWFENLFLRLIRDTPEFDVNAAYRWRDWPDRERLTRLPADDRGIDLIAVQNDGSIIAIQCKCYDESHTVQKSDIDSFLSASAESAFDERWVVSTSSLGRTAKEYINQLEKMPRLVNFHQYDDKPISDHQFKHDGRKFFELQQNAIDAVVDGLSTKDRGQLVMACGTGKTYVSLRAAERLVPNGGAILFVAPSIALVSQARREWLTHTKRPLNGLVVCSDSGTGGGDNEDIRVSDLVCKVTTDPSTIAAHMKQDSTRVVFCTYQSLDKICEAQSSWGAPEFDVTIADEAHRTTGVETGGWSQTIHDDKKMLSKKRLYMTATQRLYTAQSKRAVIKKGYVVSDMDDYEKFGTVLHRLSFKDAVEAKMLSNYKIIIMCARNDLDVHNLYTLITSDDKEHALNYEDVTRLLGTAMAINGVVYGESNDHIKQLPKVLGFSNSIKRSKAFTALLNLPELHSVVERRAKADGISLNVQHTVEHRDGNSGSIERGRALRDLENADSNSPRMLCNVKLFTEGVDVPSLDAVAFLDPRDSQVDVVQAVGRVMRKAEGKEHGYIIVPVLLEPGENVVESLESNPDGWKALGQVLRALQSHDGRLSEDPLQFLLTYDMQPGAADESPTIEGIRDVADFQEASETFYAKVVGNSGIYKPGEAVADDITYVVGLTANALLEAGAGDVLAETLGLKIGAKEFTGIYVCKIAALLITNACLMHRRLQEHIDGLTTLNSIGGLEDPVAALETAWNHILERDYAPVFEPALGVIGALPRGGSVDEAICRMADVANRTADSLSDLGYDHAGPLYHKILGTAESDSANYTNNVSALMLARLAFTNDFVNWNSISDVLQLRIMDPACGTGTLLMAALRTIKDRMSLDDTGDTIHRKLVEDVLCGLDINRHAIQLAACNLTLGAPTTDYSNMHLYTMRHGPQADGSVKAGSVEILRTTDKNDTMQAFVQPLQSIGDLHGEQVDMARPAEFPLSGLDCIIMNPPFGSNKARSRKYPSDTVKLMQKNELAIRNELVHRDQMAGYVISVNSISTFFTPLADRLLGKKNGTLVKVMPVTACIGVDGLEERKFLADRFHVECIITSHDPKHPNFSYATSIHECLMVCRRYNGDVKPPTKFVSLYRMPKNAEEAIEAADAITNGYVRSWGSVVQWPIERMVAGDWSPAQWWNVRMVEVVRNLETSPLLEKAGTRHSIGPAGRRIDDAYEECGPDDEDAKMIFRSISSKLRKTIHAAPESYHKPKATKIQLAERYWNMRSRLLIAQRFRTTVNPMTALYSDESTVGKGWIPLAVSDDREAKALVVWWNSTPCMMMLLHRRSKTLDYLKWSLNHLKEIRIPKPDNPYIDALSEAYDEISDRELQPLSDAARDPVRAIIDKAAAKVLDMDPSVLAGWRELLAREPTINNTQAGNE